jgi:tetratricopeptide (TPR) repeat protein
LELEPDSAIIRSRLAELELGLDAVELAERRLREATELDPKSARAWLGLARVAFRQGDLEESRGLAQKALRLAPDQRAPHAFLAMVLQALGDRRQALQHLEAAQSLPDHTLLWQDEVAGQVLDLRQDTDAVVQQAEQLMADGQPGQAAALLQRAIDGRPDDPRPHVLLARLLLQTRQLEQAALVLDAAAREFPGSASIHFQRGVVSFLQGRRAAAAEQFRRAIQSKPDHALAHYNLGHCLLQLDDSEAALTSFRDAVRFQPDHADARINLGRLLIERGENDAAREQLSVAAELKPQDPEPRRLLDQLSAKP